MGIVYLRPAHDLNNRQEFRGPKISVQIYMEQG
jgi:hypothetical protein